MMFLIALCCLSVVAADNTVTVYKADMKIPDSLYEKFAFNNFSLAGGERVIIPSDWPHFRNAIDDKIIAMLEAAREQFSVGFPEAGIPPLDPISIEYLYFKLYQKFVVDLDVNFNGIKVNGLKNFIINNLAMKIVGLTLQFDFTLPEMVATADYRMDGTVAVIFPFHPRGDAWVNVKGIRLNGAAVLGTNDGYLSLKGFQIGFNIDKVKIFLSGLLGDGLINDFFNWALSLISPSVINGQKDKIIAAASQFVMDLANDFLKDIKLSDLLGFEVDERMINHPRFQIPSRH